MQTESVLTNVRASKVTRARRLLKRGFREDDGLFLSEGPQACREAATAGLVRDLFITEPALERYADVASAVTASGGTVSPCSGAVIEEISSTVTPQGMVAVTSMWHNTLDDVLTPNTKLAVALTAVRDPGNAGSIIRVADAVGADGIVMSTDSVDLFNPKVVRASVGSLFHLPITTGQDLAATITRAKELGMQVLAADASGADLYAGPDLAKPTLWVFGNEAWGIPQEVIALVDAVVSIPIYGNAESLNLATASAVCLYASAQAQRS